MVYYEVGKRPIQFYRNTGDELVSADVAELNEELENCDDSTTTRVKAALKKTKQVIGIEVDRNGLTDDAWSMLDAIECFIAEYLDGIIYAPDDGYFDRRLIRIL